MSEPLPVDSGHSLNQLPPELAAFASLLDAQPGPVRAAFAYCAWPWQWCNMARPVWSKRGRMSLPQFACWRQ